MNIVTDQDKFLSMKKDDGITLNEMIDFYDERKGIKDYDKFLFNEVRNKLGSIQANKLSRYDVQDFYEPQIKNGNLHSANSRREVIQRVWNYNIDKNRQCRVFRR